MNHPSPISPTSVPVPAGNEATNAELVEQLLQYIQQAHPRYHKGVSEARAVDERRFEQIVGGFLQWAVKARGRAWVQTMADAYVVFTTAVNMEQVRYEASGRYTHHDYASCLASTYSQREVMDEYLWGVYLNNFLWAHHFRLACFYEDRFLGALSSDPLRIVDLAYGHGAWGLWALRERPNATLQGYDISDSAPLIARELSRVAGLDSRATYSRGNAMELDQQPPGTADVCICCFLVEHLEDPGRLFKMIAHVLKPGGKAFVAGALTAAQLDHIAEFRHESELLRLGEAACLRSLETISLASERQLPKARFIPRSMGLILEKDERLARF